METYQWELLAFTGNRPEVYSLLVELDRPCRWSDKLNACRSHRDIVFTPEPSSSGPELIEEIWG